MESRVKFPAAIVLLAAPLAAYADPIPNTGHVSAFVGGLVGGFVGAALACWLCRRRDSKGSTDSTR